MQALRNVPDGFSSRKVATIHAWAQAVRLVANGIDGWPPISDAVYSVEEFIEKAGHTELSSGLPQ